MAQMTQVTQPWFVGLSVTDYLIFGVVIAVLLMLIGMLIYIISERSKKKTEETIVLEAVLEDWLLGADAMPLGFTPNIK